MVTNLLIYEKNNVHPSYHKFRKTDGVLYYNYTAEYCDFRISGGGKEIEIESGINPFKAIREWSLSIYSLKEHCGLFVDILADLQKQNKQLKDQVNVLQEALDRPGNIGADIGWDKVREAMEKQP